MRLTVFNGPPRGSRGNTELLVGWFLEGFESVPANSHAIEHLRDVANHGRFAEEFRDAEAVLLAFPLYTDAMPGIVKAFIEALAPLVGRAGNPPVMFLVQSGFPEAHHARFVARYLEKLARRLGSRHIGTIVRGGCEGLHLMSPAMTKSVHRAILEIGAGFGRTGTLDARAVARFAGPEHLSPLSRAVMRLMDLCGVANVYWDMNLRKHGAWARRFARPYEGRW